MKKSIKKLVSKLGYSIQRKNVPTNPQHAKPITPDHFFDLYFSMADSDNFYFVQIGANDGLNTDLLHPYIDRYNLQGVLIEPQQHIFEKLKEVHKTHPWLQFANTAIFPDSGTQLFYTIKKSFITPENEFELTGISSFDKETFIKTFSRKIGRALPQVSENFEDYYDVTEVPVLSFDDFASKYNVKKIDFLFLDCEGVDYKILNSIDLNKYKPKVINFESKFLSDQDRKVCEDRLTHYGYQLFRHGNDTCAFKAANS